MSEVAVLSSDHTLELPADIARRFQPSDRFVVWMEGDTLHLKRLNPSPLKVVAQAPAGDALSLEEINEIVHEVRRRKHEQRAE